MTQARRKASQLAGSPRRRHQRWHVAIGLWLLSCLAAHATPPADHLAVLRRGIAVTAWFRFPASADPAALRDYLPDAAIATLRQAGFTFIRLPVQPGLLKARPDRRRLLIAAIRRVEHAGLGVVVDAHPAAWHLETRAADRAALLSFWRRLGPGLASLDPRLTFPELLNEPVFPNAPDRWQALQAALLHIVRAVLPRNTIVLTGNDWGSIAGLRALQPANDPDVVYSFHFYEPPELTSLAAYRPGLDRRVLARLPFPGDAPGCTRVARDADPATAGVVQFYCRQGWNAARITAEIAQAAAWGRRHHAALLLGEFGASAALRPTARSAWLLAVRQACEANGIGWALWGYDDVMGFDLPRPAGPSPKLDGRLLAALGLRVITRVGRNVARPRHPTCRTAEAGGRHSSSLCDRTPRPPSRYPDRQPGVRIAHAEP